MHRRADFLRTRKHGVAKGGRYFVLSTLADPELPGLRVGIITTRKVGKAHERNRLRRQVRAILQRHGEKIADPRRFLVTIVRVGASGAPFGDLERDWLKLARRLRILKETEATAGTSGPSS